MAVTVGRAEGMRALFGKAWRRLAVLLLASGMALAARSAAAGDIFSLFQPESAVTDEPDFYSVNDFGSVGLLQTRTARFGPDGMMDASASFAGQYNRYTVNWHALPWAEVSFRYTDVRNRTATLSRMFDSDQSFKDRAFDLKFKLLDESRNWPAIAVGFQDVAGTGLFSSEYLVASKRFYDFDFSLGLAWGYLGNRGGIRNPLLYLSGDRDDRGAGVGEGGRFRFSDYFSGDEISVFGGVEWRTPIEGLSLKIELDGNDYRDEPLGNRFDQDLPVNIGLNYRPISWFDAALGFERGNTLMVRAALRANLHHGGVPKFGDSPPPALRPRPAAQPDQQSRAPPRQIARRIGPFVAPPPAAAWRLEHRADAPASPADRGASDDVIIGYLFDELAALDVELVSLDFTHHEAVVHLSRGHMEWDPVAVRKIAKAVLDVAPVPLRSVTLVSSYAGGSRRRATLSRDEVRRDSAVDEFFADLERLGLEVRSVSLEAGQVVVHVASQVPTPNGRREVRLPVTGAARSFLDDSVVLRPIEALWRPNRRSAAAGAETSVRPPAPSPSRVEQHRIAERIFAALAESGFAGDGFELDALTAVVYLTPKRYPQAARNIGRAARIVANHVPASVEQITVVTMARGMELSRVSIMRRDLERAVAYRGSPEEIWANAVIEGGGVRRAAARIQNPSRYPDFSWFLVPRWRQHIGDANNFYNYQLWAALGGSVSPLPGLRLAGTLGFDIYNDFDSLKTQSNSTLARVRSDIVKYLQQGENNIANLYADYVYRPGPDWYVKAAAGIFEQMYGGVSGEVLYRPFDKRWAFGLEINWVRQRDFDQLLAFRSYDVATGHASLYYDLPIHNMQAQIHAGRYLARDLGATFQLARRFDSGVVVGGFMTFTDVSFDEFGEGSFDKGFFVTVPLDLLFTKSMRRRATFQFRPLTRDGGQRVFIPGRLYDVTGEGTLDAVARDWPRLLD